MGSSVSFTGAAGGGTIEEEMDGFRLIVETVTGQVDQLRSG